MRVLGNNSIEAPQVKSVSQNSIESGATVKVEQVSQNLVSEVELKPIANSEETKKKVQEVVGKMNDMLEATNSASKFMYHEGLERYYVSIVNRETEEVVKEIPPKRLLDAYYEMQKMLGVIVDEKI